MLPSCVRNSWLKFEQQVDPVWNSHHLPLFSQDSSNTSFENAAWTPFTCTMLSGVLITASRASRSSFPAKSQHFFGTVPKVSTFLLRRYLFHPSNALQSVIFFLFVSGKRSGSAIISSIVFPFGRPWIFGGSEEDGKIDGVFVGEFCTNNWRELNWLLNVKISFPDEESWASILLYEISDRFHLHLRTWRFKIIWWYEGAVF